LPNSKKTNLTMSRANVQNPLFRNRLCLRLIKPLVEYLERNHENSSIVLQGRIEKEAMAIGVATRGQFSRSILELKVGEGGPHDLWPNSIGP